MFLNKIKYNITKIFLVDKKPLKINEKATG